MIESKVKVQLAEGKFLEKQIGEDITVDEMMEKFIEEHAPKVSDSMRQSYKYSLKRLQPFFGEKNLLDITPKLISRYKVSRRNEGCSKATLNRELAMLSKAFNVAIVEWEWLDRNPVSRVPKEKENNERDRWLIPEEEEAIMRNSPGWLRDIVVFALNTGMRQGEILALDWPSVDLFRKVVVVKESKNGKPRSVPLNKPAFELLESKTKVRDIRCKLVFADKAGGKMDRANLRRAFSRVVNEAGIIDFRFHDLRHTFATRLAQRGFDIFAIAKILGHRDIRMTQRYAHHCSESLRKGVDLLNSDYNLTTVGRQDVGRKYVTN